MWGEEAWHSNSCQRCSVRLSQGYVQLCQSMSLWTSLNAQGHCHAGTGLGPLVPVKGNHNAKTYKDV